MSDKGSAGRIESVAAIIALLAALLVSLLVAAPANATTTKSFKPVRKTNRALVFKPRGIPAPAISDARFRGPAVRTRKVNVERLRRVVSEGTSLKVRRARTAKQPKKGKGGGRLEVDIDPAPTAAPSPGTVHTVPSSVPSGCSKDATSEILAWIATVPDNSTARFGANGCYRIEGTLELRNRTLTIDGNGSTFKSLSAPTSHRTLWRAWDSHLLLRDMALVGSYANGGTFTESLQWAHGIDLRGTRAIVEDVAMSDLAGDCVYFGLGASRSSGTVRDSSCRRTGRNGVSVVAGDDVLVQRVTTNQVGYVAFDVEPNGGPGNGSSRVSFESNTIGTYSMKAYTVIGNARVTDQQFTNNRVIGQGLEVGVVNASDRLRRLRISGNVSDTQAKHNALNLEGVDGLTISGNAVPIESGGTMAQVAHSCQVGVSGNSYPGGSREVSVVQPSC
ncbi:MAG TPA: hypothetical protein VE401_01410 [Solirubrobacterales bacterium]|nr:hypothetical protein [Solirubrobacterales bacterium]